MSIGNVYSIACMHCSGTPTVQQYVYEGHRLSQGLQQLSILLKEAVNLPLHCCLSQTEHKHLVKAVSVPGQVRICPYIYLTQACLLVPSSPTALQY